MGDKLAITERHLEQVETFTQQLDQKFTKTCGTLAQDLVTKATIKNMNTKADAASCDKILLAIKAELDRKAENDTMQSLQDGLSSLEQLTKDLQQHVGVAVRFVEWF